MTDADKVREALESVGIEFSVGPVTIEVEGEPCEWYRFARRLLAVERLCEVEWRMVLTEKIFPGREYIDLDRRGWHKVDDAVDGEMAAQSRILGEAGEDKG